MSKAIPEDVMAAASACEAEWREVDWHERNDALAPTIARAILAERERCAKIAERFDTISDYGSEQGSLRSVYLGTSKLGIVAAIRKG